MLPESIISMSRAEKLELFKQLVNDPEIRAFLIIYFASTQPASKFEISKRIAPGSGVI
jgi:hypothetical protein